eukprot:11160293-Lingulodinium_polyedra.AAC.1
MYLAQLWAGRMDYFYTLASDEGQRLAYFYVPEDMEEAPGPRPEFSEFLEGFPAARPVRDALDSLMAL